MPVLEEARTEKERQPSMLTCRSGEETRAICSSGECRGRTSRQRERSERSERHINVEGETGGGLGEEAGMCSRSCNNVLFFFLFNTGCWNPPWNTRLLSLGLALRWPPCVRWSCCPSAPEPADARPDKGTLTQRPLTQRSTLTHHTHTHTHTHTLSDHRAHTHSRKTLSEIQRSINQI